MKELIDRLLMNSCVVEGEAPIELSKAVNNLKNWPEYRRVVDDATYIANAIFNTYLPQKIFSLKSLVTFIDDKETYGVAHSMIPGAGVQLDYFEELGLKSFRPLFADRYLFFLNHEKQSMIDVIREDAILRDYDGEVCFEKKVPLQINFVTKDKLTKQVIYE